jgi:hypothetical protein
LDLEHTPVADAVSEEGVPYQRVHAPLVGSDEPPASLRCQGAGAGALDEVSPRDLTRVQDREHDGVDDESPELLGEVECQRGRAVARTMEEAEVRIQANGVEDEERVLG